VPQPATSVVKRLPYCGILWDVAACSLGDGALMMAAVSTSETLVNLYHTARRNIPEDSHLRTHRRENRKSHRISLKSLSSFLTLSFSASLLLDVTTDT
jgi:hypothetical protein